MCLGLPYHSTTDSFGSQIRLCIEMTLVGFGLFACLHPNALIKIFFSGNLCFFFLVCNFRTDPFVVSHFGPFKSFSINFPYVCQGKRQWQTQKTFFSSSSLFPHSAYIERILSARMKARGGANDRARRATTQIPGSVLSVVRCRAKHTHRKISCTKFATVATHTLYAENALEH